MTDDPGYTSEDEINRRSNIWREHMKRQGVTDETIIEEGIKSLIENMRYRNGRVRQEFVKNFTVIKK